MCRCHAGADPRCGPRSSSQAAIRTARDEVEVTGAQILFARTVRQVVNVHELQEQVDTIEGAVSATISSLQAGQASTLAANTAVMQSRMDAAASTAASAQSSLVGAMSRLTAATAASVSTSAAATDSRINAQLAAAAAANAATTRALNAQLSAAAAANLVTTRALNVSVQAAIVAANNAAVPMVYVQWGAKACTAATGATVVKLVSAVPSLRRAKGRGGGGWHNAS